MSENPYIGKTLSGFTVTEKLGQGAMGIVYKCVDPETGVAGAIKFLDGMADEIAIDRFNDEAQAVSCAKSPYIVRSLGHGQDPELGLYIIMEYIPGNTLEEFLSQSRFTLDSWYENLAMPLLTGLSHLHKQGIAHRDLKPSNLICNSDGIYKIADFGLSVFSNRKAKTKTGVIVGTPGYMAPEIINSTPGSPEEKIKEHLLSDIYSAGIVLIESLTNVHPFRTRNLGDTLQRQMKYSPTVKSLKLEAARNSTSIPDSLAKVLATAVSLSPAERFSRPLEFLSALDDGVKDTEHSTEDAADSASSINGATKVVPVVKSERRRSKHTLRRE